MKLTFKEQYEIPFEIIVTEFKCEYAQCGSHQIRINGLVELEELQKLYKNLSELKGIKEI